MLLCPSPIVELPITRGAAALGVHQLAEQVLFDLARSFPVGDLVQQLASILSRLVGTT